MQFMETITLTNTNIYLSLPLITIESPFIAPLAVMSAGLQRQRRRISDQWVVSTSGLGVVTWCHWCVLGRPRLRGHWHWWHEHHCVISPNYCRCCTRVTATIIQLIIILTKGFTQNMRQKHPVGRLTSQSALLLLSWITSTSHSALLLS